ncbi:unnamed protein product, partial [Adineta steineri]
LDNQLSRAGAFTTYAGNVDSFSRLLNEFVAVLGTLGHSTAKIYVARSIQRIKDTERVAFVKRVDLEIPNDRIIDALKNIGLDVVDVTRLNRKDINAPTGTVKITFSDTQNRNTFMHTGLPVDSMHFIAEAASQNTKPVQCYICLKYNHVAKYCKTKQQVCVKCSDNHRMDQYTVANKKGVKCTNCEDPPSSTNVINQSTTAIEQLQDTTTKKDSAVNEESEAEKLIQTIGDQSSDEMTQQLGNDGNTRSPSVIPKTQKIADVQNIDTPVNDRKQSDDEQDNGDHGISNNTRKENNVEMKETDKKYYCEFCASDGFAKKVSCSQHMRHRHLNEYNATTEVPMKKRLWTRDDMLILAELEANLTSIETINSNSALALKLPSRSREATKKRRQNYRIQDAATTGT